MTGALYTLGWRVRGRPRRWLVNHFGSLDEAVRVAPRQRPVRRRWAVASVHGMRLEMLPDGSAQSVRDRLLAEGLEPASVAAAEGSKRLNLLP